MRISTKQQNIERQIRNIKEKFLNAVIIKEVFTGTSQERQEWQKLIKIIKNGDIIVFDEVSRMSRDAKSGFQTYKELFEKGVELVFLKESYMNTESYKTALQNTISVNVQSGDNATDNLISAIMEAVNKFILNKIENDIYLAFENAQKEVDYLHQRTREGIETARLNGKQIGRQTGTTVISKKSIQAKKDILKYSKSFNGSLNDLECMRLIGLARNTFYKYKRELLTTI